MEDKKDLNYLLNKIDEYIKRMKKLDHEKYKERTTNLKRKIKKYLKRKDYNLSNYFQGKLDMYKMLKKKEQL